MRDSGCASLGVGLGFGFVDHVDEPDVLEQLPPPARVAAGVVPARRDGRRLHGVADAPEVAAGRVLEPHRLVHVVPAEAPARHHGPEEETIERVQGLERHADDSEDDDRQAAPEARHHQTPRRLGARAPHEDEVRESERLAEPERRILLGISLRHPVLRWNRRYLYSISVFCQIKKEEQLVVLGCCLNPVSAKRCFLRGRHSGRCEAQVAPHPDLPETTVGRRERSGVGELCEPQ